MLDELERLHEAATAAPWDWWTSCSYRRLTGPDGRSGSVLHAFVAHDGVPDVAIRDEDMRLIQELRNNAARLLAQARLARELTVLLCTEDGQDPVERAKALQSERLILLHKRETLVGYVESLRAALAEKDAEIERIRAEVEGDNGLRASKEAGWALAKARLDESDTTRSALRQEVNAHGNTLNTLATYQEETARLRAQVADLQEQASMACIEPRDDCDCHGCSYAAEVHAKGETKA